jgi:dethiobiotin synthetase
LFITGTNTGVGKTWVASTIARWLCRHGRRVGVYKPVLTGCSTNFGGDGIEAFEASQDDDLVLWRAAGRPGDPAKVSPQRFRAPLAAPLAARAESREVDPQLLRTGLDYWLTQSDIVLVEGAGGWMSPVSDSEYIADLALDLGFPVLIVAPNELGVINQTLQTVIAASSYRGGIAIAGIVLNHPRPIDVGADPSLRENFRELARRCTSPVLAELAWQAADFDRPIDWARLITRSQFPAVTRLPSAVSGQAHRTN